MRAKKKPTTTVRFPIELVERATREAGRRTAESGEMHTPAMVLAEWANAGATA